MYTYTIEYWKGYKILCIIDTSEDDYVYNNISKVFKTIVEELISINVDFPEKIIFKDFCDIWFNVCSNRRNMLEGDTKEAALNEVIKKENNENGEM